MLVRLEETIFYKNYILLFTLNFMIKIIVILLVHSTVCSDVIIALHQAARGL